MTSLSHTLKRPNACKYQRLVCNPLGYHPAETPAEITVFISLSEICCDFNPCVSDAQSSRFSLSSVIRPYVTDGMLWKQQESCSQTPKQSLFKFFKSLNTCMLLRNPPSLPPAFLGRCWCWINPPSWRCLSVRPQGEENKWQVHEFRIVSGRRLDPVPGGTSGRRL